MFLYFCSSDFFISQSSIERHHYYCVWINLCVSLYVGAFVWQNWAQLCLIYLCLELTMSFWWIVSLITWNEHAYLFCLALAWSLFFQILKQWWKIISCFHLLGMGLRPLYPELLMNIVYQFLSFKTNCSLFYFSVLFC